MPPKPSQRVTQADVRRWVKRLDRGDSMGQISREEGWSKGTVSKHVKGKLDSSFYRMTPEEREIPPPLKYEELGDRAKELLEDFGAFRLHYFKRSTPTFQLEMAERITAFLDGELLFLVPPGFGKSLMVSTDYPIWRMLRARAWQERFACLLCSESKDMGKRFLRQIKETLESHLDLQRDFGWFKPEHPDTWTKTQLNVDGFEKGVAKEATFEVGSPDSQINGLRLDLIIVDDLVGEKRSRSVDIQEQLEDWIHDQVESRLDPGGTIAFIGTRWNLFDVYGRLYHKTDEDTGEKIYPTILYRAHDVTKCPGPDHVHTESDEYPTGCVLWWYRDREIARGKGQRNAEKLTTGYPALMKRRKRMGSRRFDFVYNQTEVPGDDALVQPDWIEACKDLNRVLWHIPQGTRVVGTIDPAPVNYASAQVWAYDPTTEMRYLVALKRARMPAPHYFALLRDWTIRVREQGRDIRWFFEKNSANQFVLQSDEFKQLREQMQIRIYPHQTGTNKADAEYGVWSLGPLYENGLISLPWGDHQSREAVQYLVNELLGYPDAPTDDCVMAEWFFEWNIRKIKAPQQTVAAHDRSHMPRRLAAQSWVVEDVKEEEVAVG
jgi:hypothetical protein